MDNFLRDQGARSGPGRFVFTLDPEKARQKLGFLGALQPAYYFLKLVQFAAFSEATGLEIEVDGYALEARVHLPTPPEKSRVTELFHNPGLAGHEGERSLLQALYSAGDQGLWSLAPGDGTRLSLEAEGETSLEEADGGEFRFRLEKPRRRGFRRASRAYEAEIEALQNRVRAPFRIRFQNQELSPLGLQTRGVYSRIVPGSAFLMDLPECTPEFNWHDPPRHYRIHPRPRPAGLQGVSQFWNLVPEPGPDLLTVIRYGVALEPLKVDLGGQSLQIAGDFPQLKTDLTGLRVTQDDQLEVLLLDLRRQVASVTDELLEEVESYRELVFSGDERSAQALMASPLMGLPVPLALGFLKVGAVFCALSYPLATGGVLLYAVTRSSKNQSFRPSRDDMGKELLKSRLKALRARLASANGS